MPDKIRFGCYIFQNGLNFQDIRKIALECERLGFDIIWLKDNFSPWIGDWFSGSSTNGDAPVLECWTTLAALMPLTQRIRLGTVLVNLHRQPSLVAKMAATFDVISGGRLELGLSAGWNETECNSYGISFPEPAARVKMVEESLQIIESMLTKGSTSFSGDFYRIREAVCEPKPLQKPHPPLWIGGRGKKTLRLAAKYADGWIYGLCSRQEYSRALGELTQECRRRGRSWYGMRKAWYGIVAIGSDKSQVEHELNKITEEAGKGDVLKTVIAGTPEKIVKELQNYLSLGVTHFIPYFPSAKDLHPLQLFSDEVCPHLT